MFIDFATPFDHPMTRVIATELCKMPLFFRTPSYIAEMKKVVIPVAPVCEGHKCECCSAPILRTDSPMSFYEDATTECPCAEVAVDDDDHYDFDEEAYSDYIDYMLDKDYDW